MNEVPRPPDPFLLPLAEEERIDRLGSRFEREWKSGRQPRIETYLREAPAAVRPFLLRELVALDAELRRRDGQQIDVAEYRRRFPARKDQAAVEAAFAVLARHACEQEGRQTSKRGTASHDGEMPRHSGEAPTEIWTGRDEVAEVDRLLDSLPGYELHEEIGRGGFGNVMRATRRADGSVVAVKFMRPSQAVNEHRRRLFLREIEVARSLRHPGIVPIVEAGSFGESFYFVMPLCDAGGLDRWLKRSGGTLSLSSAVGVLRRCLAALAYAHRKGIVHRDLKPSNVLLKRQGDKKRVMLSDFGLAKSFQQAGLSRLTVTGQFAGTVRYMPREQVTQFRYLRPASDVWSMAAVFYRLVSGKLPREFPAGEDPVLTVLHRDAIPIRRRTDAVPRPLAEVIDRALRDEVDQRYADAAEFLRAINVTTVK